MKYYGTSYFNTLTHSGTKRDLNGTSVSDEKGTDNKANNTSAYNHDYYVHHKDKWDVKTEDNSTPDDDAAYDEKNRIGNSNFFAFKDKNGRWVIMEEDMKWSLPEGTELTSSLKSKLDNFKASSPGNFEKEVLDLINAESDDFDIDAAARDVIRGKYKNGLERKQALGDDYEKVQRRVNEMLLGNSGGISESKEEPKEKSTSSSSSKSSSNTWYTRHERKIEEKKEKSANK